MGHVMHVGLLGLFGGVLVVGCSLSGLVFDRDGGAGSGASTGTAGGGVGGGDPVGSSVGAGGGDGGVVIPPTCVSGEPGGVGGAGEVNCNDGKDNDKNFLIDCADPHCAALGYKCFAVPDGWTSLGAFYETTPGSATCCPKDFPVLGPAGGQSPSGEDPTCNPCTCDPAGVQCSLATLVGSTDLCTTTAPINVVVGQCQPVTGITSFKMGAPTPSAPSCLPTGGGVSVKPDFTWALNDRVCLSERTSKFCGGEGRFCTRSTPEAPLCIWRTGAATCPTEFPQSHTFFTGVNDTRDCPASSCTCGAPNGTGSCSVATALYSTTNCTLATLGNVPATGACTQPTNTTLPVQSVLTTSTPGNNPTCTPSSIAPQGDVVANQDTLTTVCCP